MAKNATRRKKSARLTSNNNAAKNSTLTLWVLVGIILGILITFGFLHWQKQQKNLSNNQAKKTVASQSHKPVEFDFYQILPNIKPKDLSATKEITTKKDATPNTATSLNLVNNSDSFILQINSTKDFSMADKIRAELTLMGYNPVLRTVNFQNGLVYQLNLGPYDSIESARAVQKKLEINKISSVLVKEPGVKAKKNQN